MTWTTGRVEMLRSLAGEGFSAKEIASALGAEFTRNAVIGKSLRLGIQLSGKNGRKGPLVNIVTPKAEPEKTAPEDPPKPKAPLLVAEVVEIVEEARPQRKTKTLIELENHHCRWPYEIDGEWRFCGLPEADLVAGTPYCREHEARATNIGKPRRRVTTADRERQRLARLRKDAEAEGLI